MHSGTCRRWNELYALSEPSTVPLGAGEDGRNTRLPACMPACLPACRPWNELYALREACLPAYRTWNELYALREPPILPLGTGGCGLPACLPACLPAYCPWNELYALREPPIVPFSGRRRIRPSDRELSRDGVLLTGNGLQRPPVKESTGVSGYTLLYIRESPSIRTGASLQHV